MNTIQNTPIKKDYFKAELENCLKSMDLSAISPNELADLLSDYFSHLVHLPRSPRSPPQKPSALQRAIKTSSKTIGHGQTKAVFLAISEKLHGQSIYFPKPEKIKTMTETVNG